MRQSSMSVSRPRRGPGVQRGDSVEVLLLGTRFNSKRFRVDPGDLNHSALIGKHMNDGLGIRVGGETIGGVVASINSRPRLRVPPVSEAAALL